MWLNRLLSGLLKPSLSEFLFPLIILRKTSSQSSAPALSGPRFSVLRFQALAIAGNFMLEPLGY
jgi:hypothetical protein